MNVCLWVFQRAGGTTGGAHQALSQGPLLINNKAHKAEGNMDYGYLTEQKRDADCTRHPFPSVAGVWVVNFNLYLFRGIHFQGQCNKKNHLQSVWNTKGGWPPCQVYNNMAVYAGRTKHDINEQKNLRTRQYGVHFNCWVLSFLKNDLAGRKSRSYDG